MDIDIKIKGMAQINEALKQLPGKMMENVMRGALRAGGKVLVSSAKRRVSTQLGGLQKSIRVSARVRAGVASATVKAGDGKKIWYAHLVENGTQPHTIKPRKRKSLVLAGVLREIVNHPGAKAKPFFRPAMDEDANEALLAIGEYCRTRLSKAGIDVAPDSDDPED